MGDAIGFERTVLQLRNQLSRRVWNAGDTKLLVRKYRLISLCDPANRIFYSPTSGPLNDNARRVVQCDELSLVLVACAIAVRVITGTVGEAKFPDRQS